MFTKWPTEFLPPSDPKEGRRFRSGRKATFAARSRLAVPVLLAFSVLFAGCSLLPDEPEEEYLEEIALPQISKKPEYEVTTQTLETTVSGSGRLLSTQETTLYFTLDNRRIKTLYVFPGDWVEAGQPVAELDVDDLRDQLRMQQLSFKQEELAMKDLLRRRDEMDPVEFESRIIQFEEKRQALVDLEEQISQAVLTAPFSGTVVSLAVQPGGQVKAYDPVAVIANSEELIAAVTLSSNDLNKVAPGMEVRLSINNVGERMGVVKALPSAERDRNPWGQPQQPDRLDQYLLVEVRDLPDTAQRGTPLSVQVILNRKENAVVIPLAALRTIGTRTYVQVVEPDGTKREVDVRVGQQTSTVAEILEGLTPGQKVVGR
jgi:macrolide-specific efflux system membrane fusion protein